MNDFSTETQVGEVFLGAQPSQRAGHQRPSTFLELPYLHPNVLTYRATKYDNTWGSGVPREWGTSVPKIFLAPPIHSPYTQYEKQQNFAW